MKNFDFIEGTVMSNLKQSEGLRLRMYYDTKGICTIGYGHNLEANGISQEVADIMLAEDVNAAWEDLKSACPWIGEAPDTVVIVLWDMCFNMGLGNRNSGFLSFHRSLELIHNGKYEQAARNMSQSKWARDVGPRRSGRLMNLLREAK